ncbi:hypothetical protein MMC11_008415 [Xylographa trunciseda]|nr:hypothetical protein [Xylographa trunciseda]
MAAASSEAPAQRRHHSGRRTRASKHKPRSSTSSVISGEDGAHVLDVEKVRRARADYYATPSEDRGIISSSQMVQDGEQGRRSAFRDDSELDVTAGSYDIRSKSHTDHRHRRRKQKDKETVDDGVYVYKSTSETRTRRHTSPRRIPRPEGGSRSTNIVPDGRQVLRTLGLDGQSRSGEQKEVRRVSRPASIRRSSSQTGERRTPTREPRRLGSDTGASTSNHRPRVARSVSMRETSSRSVSRPTLARSQSSTRRVRRVATDRPSLPPVLEVAETVVTSSRKIERPSNILGSIFGGQKPTGPEAQIECLTCMSDDIPVSKSAKLACGHRMCHACLRRIFTMSVTDPAHMPPTCCTSEHIPLKHVDKLFDLKFKMKWNKKYQEYTTANRLYCPAKGCGEWIKPTHIYTDTSGGANGGRKYGKCARCKTKICPTCNGRWHSGRECPKDDATAEFAAIAKAQGWQRCFNCSATVELKEGCNHMTCRCRAEFCMICGAKWKSCDCPWFNYAAVEHDRLLHLNVAQARVEGLRADGMPRAYHDELERRRAQERDDEAFARRMQGLHLVEHPEPGNNYPDGVFALGNAAGHFLNERFVHRATNLLAATYAPTQADLATSPPPPQRPVVLLRQHSAASRRYNGVQPPRAAQHADLRHVATDYASGAVRARPPAAAAAACEAARPVAGARRHSAMAGLTRDTPDGRVDEWRRHVEEDDDDDDDGSGLGL